MKNVNQTQHGWFYWLVMGICLTLLSAGLVFLALLALKMRLSGDDYCFNAVLSQKGFWRMQTYSYFNVSMVSGNRFSQTLFSGLAGLSPTWGNGLLVVSCLVVWVTGLAYLIRWGTKQLRIKLTLFKAFLLAEGFVCLVLWSTQKLDQSVLWRSAMTAYFMPMVAFTWVLLFIIWAAESKSGKWWKLIGIFLAAVIGAGFSETGAAVQGGFLGLAMIGVIIQLIRKDSGAKKFLFPVLVSILGVLAAVGLLYFSPVTEMRRTGLPDPITLRELIYLLGWNLKVYLWQALMRRTLTVIIPVVFGLGLGLIWLLSQRNQEEIKPLRLTWKQALLFFVLLAIASVVLILCVMLPSTYVQADYPPERTLILAQAVLTSACITGGVFFVLFVDSLLKIDQVKTGWIKGILHVVSLVLALCVLVSPILLVHTNADKLPFYTRWASLWDERHEQLLAAGQENAEEIHVIQLDHVIDDVGELSPDPAYWYNNCAEMYYGIDEIYADQPGW